MPLTQAHLDKLAGFGFSPQKDTREQHPTWMWLHGFVIGLDGLHIPGDPEGLLACDQDLTTYHVLIRDMEAKQYPLRQLLVGGTTVGIVARLERSSDPSEIETFIHKWVDPNFKF